MNNDRLTEQAVPWPRGDNEDPWLSVTNDRWFFEHCRGIDEWPMWHGAAVGWSDNKGLRDCFGREGGIRPDEESLALLSELKASANSNHGSWCRGGNNRLDLWGVADGGRCDP